MCGIAGIVDLTGGHPVPPDRLRRMMDALVHRGPDEEGTFHDARVGLASRRLSIVGLAPVANEDGSVRAVFNGELFDHPDVTRPLQSSGHRLTTHCDSEVLPHRPQHRPRAAPDRLAIGRARARSAAAGLRGASSLAGRPAV